MAPRMARAFLVLTAAAATAAVGLAGPAARAVTSPIKHVVVIFMENQSFDELIGYYCVQHPARGCRGASSGKAGTATVALGKIADLIPDYPHGREAGIMAINKGAMNGFNKLSDCQGPKYGCYVQVKAASQATNTWALTAAFAISDATFQDQTAGSWGAHIGIGAGTYAGFTGDQPHPTSGLPIGPGWGCDSNFEAKWKAPTGSIRTVPSCVPKPDGSGAYKKTPVKWVPTIMDRLDGAGLSWRIYTSTTANNVVRHGVWAICPTFASCLYSDQVNKMVANGSFVPDAQAGNLPAFSFLIPHGVNSMHNNHSMLQGDNWLGAQVQAVMDGPDWSSTAIFVTWDDFGGFYDHMAPGGARGIRVPMIMVSPYAKAGYTDPKLATFSSILAYAEHTFGLAPLATWDANAYDYGDSFDYTQTPLSPIRMTRSEVPAWEQRWIATHHIPDPDDPVDEG